MKHIIVYGSLKKDKFNYGRFSGQKFLKPVDLKGFDLFDLGAYPTVCRGHGQIKAELHEVSDETADYIGQMESGAGFFEESVSVELHGRKIHASIYTWPKYKINEYGCPKIESGDWQ